MKNILGHIKNRIIIDTNRFLIKEFIPSIKEHIYIETSAICNLNCVFCAYSKKTLPKVVMGNEFFFKTVEECTDYGFDSFGLTPLTGDIFTDSHIFDKLDYLEKHNLVKNYHFFTNFTLLDKDKIQKLLSLIKLSLLSLSIYGHDKNSFVSLTRTSDKIYEKLIDNLDYLKKTMDGMDINLEVHCRTMKSFDISKKYDSSLADLLKFFMFEKNIPVIITKEYHNWGNLIIDEEVKSFDIDFIDKRYIYKNGACSLLFYKFIILADGRINGCACRDVNASLLIGDLKERSLKEILSKDNRKYMDLINSQQKNKFPPVCKNCTYYSSIYRHNHFYKNHKKPITNLNGFYDEISQKHFKKSL